MFFSLPLPIVGLKQDSWKIFWSNTALSGIGDTTQNAKLNTGLTGQFCNLLGGSVIHNNGSFDNLSANNGLALVAPKVPSWITIPKDSQEKTRIEYDRTVHKINCWGFFTAVTLSAAIGVNYIYAYGAALGSPAVGFTLNPAGGAYRFLIGKMIFGFTSK